MTITQTQPPVFHRTVLRQEAPGGKPAFIECVVPSITAPGVPVDVNVAVVDKHGYPACRNVEPVTLRDDRRELATLSFDPDGPAVGRLTGVIFQTAGTFRLQAQCGAVKSYSNPSLCTPEDIPGIFWGDPHVHTVLSNCHPDKCRSLNFCFSAGRYVSALDWVAAADHVSGGRCEFAKWKAQIAASNAYNTPPEFVTLPAYEASLPGGRGGDNNVYMSRFPEMYSDAATDGNIKTLCGQLAETLPADSFFVVPHHTTRAGKHGEITDDIYPGADRMPVIEIHSKWGTSEYRGNPHALKTIHPGPSYAVDLLNRGLKLGFIAGTDTHATLPSGGGIEPGHIDRLPGLTAVRTHTLDRQSVFDAIRHRQCYGASLERIILHGTIAGCAFGGDVALNESSATPEIDVRVAARSDIARIEIVKCGNIIHAVEPGTWTTRVRYTDTRGFDADRLSSPHLGDFVYYYVRVSCVSGAQAWSSPVWIVGTTE